MEQPWPLPIGVYDYERIHASPRDLYLLPLPYTRRTGILFPQHSGLSSAPHHTGIISIPVILTKYLRNNAYSTAPLRVNPPVYWKLFDQREKESERLPSDALRDLYRLALRIYGDFAIGAQPSQIKSRPETGSSREGSTGVPSPLTSLPEPSRHGRIPTGPSIADSTTSFHTLNASTLIGSESYIYSQQVEDIKSTIHDLAASVKVWNTSRDEGGGHGRKRSLEGVHFNPIKVGKDDELWKHELLNVLNAYRDSVENNTALHSDASRLQEELSSSQSQISALKRELKTLQISVEEQASQLTESFNYERRCREEADAEVATLQGEMESLKDDIKGYVKQIEEGRVREQMLHARYETLQGTFEDLKAQLFEPAWVGQFKAELRGDLKALGRSVEESQSYSTASNEEVVGVLKKFEHSTHSSLGHISSEFRHQKDEIAQLRERTSQLVASNETIVVNTSSTVQGIDTVIRENNETREALTALSSIVDSQVASISSVLDSKLSHIDSAVHETGHSIKAVVGGIDAKLNSHHSKSQDRLGDISNVLHEHSKQASKHHANVMEAVHENKTLIKSLEHKVHEQITSAATTFANIPVKSGDGEGDVNATLVAVEGLRASLSSSTSGIREAVDQANIAIQKLMAQFSSQVDQHGIMAKNADSTTARIEELAALLRQTVASEENAHKHTQSLLANTERTLATLTTAEWVEQAFENSKVSKREDLESIQSALQSIAGQVEGLSRRGDGGVSGAINELITQVADINLKLTELEAGIQSAATTSDVVEEISTVKVANDHGHQASTAAAERIKSAVENLEEYTRSAIDQINAALDEQQSRLVSIQSHTKQHSEETKILTSNLAEHTAILRTVESHTQSAESTSTSIQSVLSALQEIKSSITVLESTRSADAETLHDAPASSDALAEVLKQLQAHLDTLRSIPQTVFDKSAERHDSLAARTVEILTLLTGIVASSERSSSEIESVKGLVTKLEAEMLSGNEKVLEGISASGASINGVSETVQGIVKEVVGARADIASIPSAETAVVSLSERLDTLLSELTIKTDAVTTAISESRGALVDKVAQLNQQSENVNGSLSTSVEGLTQLVKSSSSGTEVAALHALIEKQTSELNSLESQLSKAQSVWLSELKTQIDDLRGVIMDTTITEVMESLKLLNTSVTEIRRSITEDGQSNSASAEALKTIETGLKANGAQLMHVLRAHETHDKQHEATMALLERNQSALAEFRSAVESEFVSTKELSESHHTAVSALVEKTMTIIEANAAQPHDNSSEVLKALSEVQQALEQHGSAQSENFNTRITAISQALSELRLSVEQYSSSTVDLRQHMEQITSTNSSLNVAIDQQFKETITVFNDGLESLRQQMLKNPEQTNTLLVALQARISELHEFIQSTQQSLEQSFKSELTIVHHDRERMVDASSKSLDGLKIRLTEEKKELDDQLHRMEELQHAVERLVSNHHCNGCNCRGYDSNLPSPNNPRKGFSTIGSDATGLSPHPYHEQSFDVPSPRNIRKDSISGEGARGYTIDFEGSPEGDTAQSSSPIAVDPSGDAGNATGERVYFPRPNSPLGSARSHNRTSSGQPTTSSGGDAHHHHHHDHDHEISNPFQFFGSRARKTSHKPSEGSDESHDAQQRPRATKSSTIGSGKSQRQSLLASALISAVSDTSVPTASRHRTVSGGLHRLSSVFGKKHHHDDSHSKSTEDAAKAKGSSSEVDKTKDNEPKEGQS